MGGTSSGLSSSADAFAGAPVAAEGAADMAKSAAGGGTVARQAAAPMPTQSRVVKTASLTVSLDKATSVTKAAQQANSIAERHGGFTASTETQTGEHATSTLTLRVPVANYDATLNELRALGDVSNETLGGEDVTNTLVDLDARLRSLRAQEGALNALMAKANSVGETLQVAQAANDVRMQIEQLAAQQKNLSDQADFATITLAVVGPKGVIEEAKGEPVLVTAFERAVGGTLDVFGGAIVVLGYAMPAGLIAAMGYAVLRLRRRRIAAVA